MALLAWAAIAAVLYVTGKPYDAESVIWTGIILIAFIMPFLPTYLRAKRYPFIDGAEQGVSSGVIGNLLFLAMLIGVVLSVAAAASLIL